ncbi:MAG: helix-turn-helix transcriptional regulator [Vulcanimicrobiaceae bacterium]|jgi:DNA-binding CsgD family transcriptional regulator
MSTVAGESSEKLPRKSQDPTRLLRELEARFRGSTNPHERAMLADSIVPEYVSHGDAVRAAEIIDGVADVDDADLSARITTLRAIVEAMHGNDPRPLLERAFRLASAGSPSTIAVVHHRAGVAYFNARLPHEAEKHALQALWLLDADGQRRLAARAASVLYGVHYHLTGDLHSARYYAEVGAVEATAAGDMTIRRLLLCVQLDLAVSFGEWDRARSLVDLLRRDRWYDSYSGGQVAQFGMIMLHGHSGDFAAMKGAVDTFIESANANADYALGNALSALALAGSGIDDEAAIAARRAIGLGREKGVSELAYHSVRRRLASVIGAYVCVLIGDVHRGSRALESKTKLPGYVGAFARALYAAARGAHVDVADPTLQNVRGLVELLAGIKRLRLDRVARIPERIRTLTHTELTLLRATATGKTNGEIAKERGVTRNAVERRLMSAYEKLGVKNRTEAIAKLAEI